MGVVSFHLVFFGWCGVQPPQTKPKIAGKRKIVSMVGFFMGGGLQNRPDAGFKKKSNSNKKVRLDGKRGKKKNHSGT